MPPNRLQARSKSKAKSFKIGRALVRLGSTDWASFQLRPVRIDIRQPESFSFARPPPQSHCSSHGIASPLVPRFPAVPPAALPSYSDIPLVSGVAMGSILSEIFCGLRHHPETSCDIPKPPRIALGHLGVCSARRAQEENLTHEEAS